MKYLITGATGDVGARVVDLLVRRGDRPRVFVRDAHKARSRVGDKVALAPLDFRHFSHDLLVGQFAGAGDTQSSGYGVAYDLVTGKFDGLLQDATGKPLAVNGICSLSPGNVSPDNRNARAEPAGQVFFTAGPNHQTQGLFGFLTAVPCGVGRRERPVIGFLGG